MRYQFWDVLLFPHECYVPIQEFKTACYAAQDGSAKVPILTSFIPALPRGTRFRISLHSWKGLQLAAKEKPGKEKDSDGVAETVMYTVRVLIDGLEVVRKCYDESVSWPETIENTHISDATGEIEPLRFPAFHREVLGQAHWNAVESIGRIKVIVSQRVRKVGPKKPSTPPAEEVVCFSFQHVPLELLEQKGIAWPNPGIWHTPIPHAPHNMRPSMPPGYVPYPTMTTSYWDYGYSTPPKHHSTPTGCFSDHVWTDPPDSIGNRVNRSSVPYIRSDHGSAKSSSSFDTPMRDISGTSKTSSIRSGDGTKHIIVQVRDDQFSKFLESLSPSKDDSTELHDTSRKVSLPTAFAVPAPKFLLPASTAETIAPAVRPTIADTNDADQLPQYPHLSEKEDVNMKEPSDYEVRSERSSPAKKVKESPSLNIRSRKEGKENNTLSIKDPNLPTLILETPKRQNLMIKLRVTPQNNTDSPSALSPDSHKRSRAEMMGSEMSIDEPDITSPLKAIKTGSDRFGLESDTTEDHED